MPSYKSKNILPGSTASASCGTNYNDLVQAIGTWNTCNSTQNHWVKAQLPIAKRANKVVVGGPSGDYAINAWHFEGSNDGNNWTLLQTLSQSNGSDQVYEFTNAVFYLYYQLHITATQYSGGATGVGIWRVYELADVKSFSGVSNPWIFLKDAFDNHKKLWQGKKLLLPKDLGFEY